MPITQRLNSKGNIKKFTNQDLPFSPQQPVMSSFYAVSTAGQTVINLSYSVDTTASDQFFLFVDGKKLRLGASNDYQFTSIGSDSRSSQVTLNYALPINLNIQAYVLGLKSESEFGVDNRFTQLYAAQGASFNAFVNQFTLIQPTVTTGSPVAGTFYTTVVNRAPMTDLTQDLKARMGIERIQIMGVYQIQNEFGPAGELVWGTVNDLFGQIRFVGSNWGVSATSILTYGNTLINSVTNDYVEITFYGTGLNLLCVPTGGAKDWRASIDGGAEGSNLVPNAATTADATGNRNYAPNTILNIYSGLTLGVHTVKIRSNSTANLNISGFEVLNESSSVKVTPGVGYTQGQKYTSSALQSFAYNSVATGTRGGRVLLYQNGDGSIGKAWQPVNAAQANLTSADHTNEEIVRSYNFREFGAARSDDFSITAPGVSNVARAFTLDDGTTTLISDAVSFNNAASQEGIFPFNNGNFITLTFVGTGLDIFRSAGTSNTITYTVLVDGTSIGTLAAQTSSTSGYSKIVSGLPYGTHTVKFQRSGGSSSEGISRFIAYQPKKPSIPSGAIELADYNVMATYVANTTAAVDNIGTGTLRKYPTRESTYVNGTGGSADWVLTFTSATMGFWQANSDRTNAAMSYTFFGTGFDFRFDAGSNRSGNISVTLNGLAATTANFATMTSSVYGTGVTFAAGVLDQLDAAGQNGSGLSISNLPLNTYTVKFNNNSAGAFFIANAFDIITPIHSTKSSLYADFQNTLPVGSNAISDNRKTTPIANSTATKAWAQASGVTSGPTTTSTSFIPLPDMSVTVRTSGGALKVSYSVTASNSVATANFSVQAYVDGTAVGQPRTVSSPTNGATQTAADSIKIPVSAGTHKVDLFWNVNGNTGTAQGLQRDLLVEET